MPSLLNKAHVFGRRPLSFHRCIIHLCVIDFFQFTCVTFVERFIKVSQQHHVRTPCTQRRKVVIKAY